MKAEGFFSHDTGIFSKAYLSSLFVYVRVLHSYEQDDGSPGLKRVIQKPQTINHTYLSEGFEIC